MRNASRSSIEHSDANSPTVLLGSRALAFSRLYFFSLFIPRKNASLTRALLPSLCIFPAVWVNTDYDKEWSESQATLPFHPASISLISACTDSCYAFFRSNVVRGHEGLLFGGAAVCRDQTWLNFMISSSTFWYSQQVKEKKLLVFCYLCSQENVTGISVGLQGTSRSVWAWSLL